MSKGCSHIAGIQTVTPSALGCEECLKSGSAWLHLRICRTCGHVGCCDDSPEQARHRALPCDRPSRDRRLRSAGRLGLVLCRRSAVRSVEPKNSTQRADTALLLIPLSTKNEEISHAMLTENAARHRFRHLDGPLGRIDFLRALRSRKRRRANSPKSTASNCIISLPARAIPSCCCTALPRPAICGGR